ncbi:hypothetical protein SIL08_18055 [Scandinavium sp. V105_16]|uniref:PepSY domain-containing protein n=1 Tax=Scandinavium lactucae TaxID=3095028 RepID=A0AAJ2S3U9_9ENTR|nr:MULTISPECIES: hypothetical protein [unclassified Scandinavium]MDX6022182.1 hypothetical protein [Scandinavium sp. V105_16]MDX6033976.1 hypothetical protein [Scandinavium sp. V105_12]
MMKKLMMIASVVAACGLFSVPASAISEAYRAQLEKSGCTQISEADGTCDPTHVKKHAHNTHDDKATPQNASRDLHDHLVGKTLSQAIGHMHNSHWNPLNEEETRWGKSDMIAELDLTPAGKIRDVWVH